DNRASVSIDALNNRTTTLFDAAGNVTGSKDADGNLTQYLFDADNRPTVTIDPLTNRTTSLLDAAGNVTGMKDANGNLTQYQLDGEGKVTVPGQILIAFVAKLWLYEFWPAERRFAELLRILEKRRDRFPNSQRSGC